MCGYPMGRVDGAYVPFYSPVRKSHLGSSSFCVMLSKPDNKTLPKTHCEYAMTFIKAFLLDSQMASQYNILTIRIFFTTIRHLLFYVLPIKYINL